MNKFHNWINTALICITMVLILVLVGGNQSDQTGGFTRFPNSDVEAKSFFATSGTGSSTFAGTLNVSGLFKIGQEGDLLLTGSSTVGIGTSSASSLLNGMLVIDGDTATPTIATFATSTNPSAVNQAGFGGCIQLQSPTSSQPYMIYIGGGGDGSVNGVTVGGILTIEQGTCQ